MKKSLAFVTVVAALAVAGCNNKNKPKSGTTTEIAPASQPPVAYVPPQQATPDTMSTPSGQATEVTPAPAEMAPESSAHRSSGASAAHRRTAPKASHEVASSSSHHARITGKKYTVKKGDTLSEIVKAKYGTTKKMKAVLRANPGLDADHIKVGQVITLP